MDIPAGDNLLLLQVPLVPPGVLANHSDCVSAAMKIAIDTEWADSSDYDYNPIFEINDGEKYIGFQIGTPDNINGTKYPCHIYEGNDVNNMLKYRAYKSNGHKLSSNFVGNSSEIKIQIKPCENWGSCHTEDEGGFVFIANYQYNLDLAKGLFLNMERNDDAKSYHIIYITVDVDKDGIL